jgi:predicted NBD/HSP70 family sugar kinase
VSSPLVLGLDFGGSKIAAGVAAPGVAPLATATIGVRPDESASDTFQRGVDAVRSLLVDAAPQALPVAVGACTIGIPRTDGVDLAPNIAGWEQFDFGARVQAAFPGLPTRIGNDVKVAAQAELTGGALAGCDTGVYVNLGTGLATALVVGGRVLSGAHGAAGEIGYNLRYPGSGIDGTRLEDVVSGKALSVASTGIVGAADVAALFAREQTDLRARRLCAQFLDELAYHLVNLTIALDPSRVVVGGGLVRLWPRLAPPLTAALQAAVPFPPELVRGAFPFDAPLLGALAMASDAYRAAQTVRQTTVPEGAPA